MRAYGTCYGGRSVALRAMAAGQTRCRRCSEACHAATRCCLGSNVRPSAGSGILTARRLLRVRTTLLLFAALYLLRPITDLLPAGYVVPLLFSAWILWTPAWLLRTGRALLWLLWCPSLLSIARLLVSPAVSIDNERAVARQARVEDLLALPRWNYAIAS